MKTKTPKPVRIPVLGKNRNTISLLIFLSLIFTLAFHEVSGGIEIRSATTWTMVRTDGGITIFERRITLEGFPEGRQLQLDFNVRGDLIAAVSLVSNAEMADQWMSAIKSFKILEKVNACTWYSYILYDIPWPLKKQDVIIRNTLTVQPGAPSARIEMKACAEYLPESKGVSRISHVLGTWVFTKISENLTRVQYFIYSGQRSSFPRWITDPIIQGNLIKTMTGFRSIIEQQSGATEIVTHETPVAH